MCIGSIYGITADNTIDILREEIQRHGTTALDCPFVGHRKVLGLHHHTQVISACLSREVSDLHLGILGTVVLLLLNDLLEENGVVGHCHLVAFLANAVGIDRILRFVGDIYAHHHLVLSFGELAQTGTCVHTIMVVHGFELPISTSTYGLVLLTILIEHVCYFATLFSYARILEGINLHRHLASFGDSRFAGHFDVAGYD